MSEVAANTDLKLSTLITKGARDSPDEESAKPDLPETLYGLSFSPDQRLDGPEALPVLRKLKGIVQSSPQPDP
jgi:hypothetical protein